MKSHFIPVLICLGAALLLCGCTFARNKINVEDFHAKAESIVVGQTTAQEVIDIIGSPPNGMLQLRGDKAYVYTFGDAKSGGLNLILFGTQRTNSGIDTAYIFLDQNDVVKQMIVSNHSKDLDWDWWAFGD